MLAVEGLSIAYAGGVLALDGATLSVAADEAVALVGESGSGKTTLGMAVGRLLPAGAARLAGGLTLAGSEVFAADAATLRRLRRERLGFVFQNPMTALDPTMRVGRQVTLALGGRPGDAAVRDLLAEAGLGEPERVARSFPHELSGGMAQRVVIAMAIARRPALLVADEPTASLDASIRETVMATLGALRRRSGASLLLLSHDLASVRRHCTRIAVMYGGRVVESAESELLFRRPAHPYSRALLAAAAGREGPGGRLSPIPGSPPLLRGPSRGCAFAPRCSFAVALCADSRPQPRAIEGRQVLCHRAEAVLAAP